MTSLHQFKLIIVRTSHHFTLFSTPSVFRLLFTRQKISIFRKMPRCKFFSLFASHSKVHTYANKKARQLNDKLSTNLLGLSFYYHYYVPFCLKGTILRLRLTKHNWLALYIFFSAALLLILNRRFFEWTHQCIHWEWNVLIWCSMFTCQK